MKSFTLFYFAALLLTFATCLLAAPTKYPVCIVGAGPAGLIAANRLENRGQPTIIFEKQVSVGGKCQAIYADSTFHPLGALLFSNDTYVEALKVIDASGVLSVPFSTGQTWEYNWTSGVTIPEPAVTLEFEALVAEEYARYSLYWYTIFAPYSAIRYKNGVPQEFTVTTVEWLANNDFEALPVVFVQAMVAYGYGDLREVPILYMLQYLTPDILGSFLQLHSSYLIDFHEVFIRFANSSITGPVHLNTTITGIDRLGSQPVIRYANSVSNGVQAQTCSAIILAFPPTLPALYAANLDVSANEQTVFGPVGLSAYFSSAVRLNTPPFFFEAESAAPDVPVDADGEPVAFLQLFPTSNIATAWSWGPYRGNLTLDQARTLLKETLSKVNKDPTNSSAVPQPVTDADILGFQQNDYFPHFDSQQLAGGWYDKFNALQGQNNTYYASGLNGFETVEFALRAGIDIVESYF